MSFKNILDMPAPGIWNPNVDEFDPVRAGFRQAGHRDAFRCEVPEGEFFLTRYSKTWEIASWDDPNYARMFCDIPRTMPDGTPRSHADVISILRANGWTGGDDE